MKCLKWLYNQTEEKPNPVLVREVSEPVLMMVKAIRERPKTIHFSSEEWSPLWAWTTRVTVHSTVNFKIHDTVTGESWTLTSAIGLNGIYAQTLGEFLLSNRVIFNTPRWMTHDEVSVLIDTFHEVYGARQLRLRDIKAMRAHKREMGERQRLCKVYRNA